MFFWMGNPSTGQQHLRWLTFVAIRSYSYDLQTDIRSRKTWSGWPWLTFSVRIISYWRLPAAHKLVTFCISSSWHHAARLRRRLAIALGMLHGLRNYTEFVMFVHSMKDIRCVYVIATWFQLDLNLRVESWSSRVDHNFILNFPLTLRAQGVYEGN